MTANQTQSRQYMMAFLVFALALMLFPGHAWASAGGIGGGVFSAIDKVIQILQGLARPLAVILIAVGGFTWAFSRNEEGMKKIGQAIIGMAIAIGAMSFAGSLGLSGATF